MGVERHLLTSSSSYGVEIKQRCFVTLGLGSDGHRLRKSCRKKVDEKSCVTFLCDPGWAGTSNELDVQNEGEENTHTHSIL